MYSLAFAIPAVPLGSAPASPSCNYAVGPAPYLLHIAAAAMLAA